MSYSFQVRKRAGILELVGDLDLIEQLAAHVPDDAVFTINGHSPTSDSSTIGTVGVTLVLAHQAGASWIGSATGSYNTAPAPPDRAEPKIHQASGTVNVSSGGNGI